jgi:hypothetical protein
MSGSGSKRNHSYSKNIQAPAMSESQRNRFSELDNFSNLKGLDEHFSELSVHDCSAENKSSTKHVSTTPTPVKKIGPTIRILIGPKTPLTFTKPSRVGEGKITIFLHGTKEREVPVCRAKIGQNSYLAVSDWEDKCEKNSVTKITLHAGTSIISTEGLPISLAADIEVELPKTCPVIFVKDAKFLQTDVPVQMTLNANCEGIIFFD